MRPYFRGGRVSLRTRSVPSKVQPCRLMRGHSPHIRHLLSLHFVPLPFPCRSLAASLPLRIPLGYHSHTTRIPLGYHSVTTLNITAGGYPIYLSIVHCQLSTVHCQLSIVNCPLSTINCQLSTVHCQLLIVNCPLFSALVVLCERTCCWIKLLSLLRNLPNGFAVPSTASIPSATTPPLRLRCYSPLSTVLCPTFNCQLSIVNCQLSTVNCQLPPLLCARGVVRAHMLLD